MNLLNRSARKSALVDSITPNSKSNSVSSSSPITTNQQIYLLDKRLWRSIDFLHIIVMVFSFYTAIIVAILRNELFEQCPLYAKLYLRDNATRLSTDTIDQQLTEWGSVFTCEFASFAYLSAFVLSFISLWIHIVFRRVLRTERLIRLPIGISILISGLVATVTTCIVTDGVIKFCLNSPANICSSSGPAIFSRSRWKIISLPVGGWLTTISILINVFVRGIQLFSKPKKSPEALKSLLNQLMTHRQQQKLEKESSEYGSQISQPSRDRNRLQPSRQYSTEHIHNRELSTELYPYYYPSIPQYRQIEKKRSRFHRICCPCFRRRRRRSVYEPYRPYVVPEEYFHRLNHLKQNGTVPNNLCSRHSTPHPVEQHTQTDLIPQRKTIDETPFLGRRRSSVRFEDETPLVKIPDEPSTSSSTTKPIPIIIKKDEETTSPVSENDLQRNVSFRNNEDDLWTTVIINAKPSVPIQSSHYNRLSVENSSFVNTSISNSDNGVTAIHVNSRPTEFVSSDIAEKEIPIPPPPPPPPPKTTRIRSTANRPKPPPPSRSHTTSSEDDVYLRNIKPVEEINTLVAEKYNYNDVSQALKSNVERLKNTFIHAQETESHYDKPKNTPTKLLKKSFENCNVNSHSSDC